MINLNHPVYKNQTNPLKLARSFMGVFFLATFILLTGRHSLGQQGLHGTKQQSGAVKGKSKNGDKPALDPQSPQQLTKHFIALGRNVGNITYFLDEIGIVDDQAKAIREAADQYFDHVDELEKQFRKLGSKMKQIENQSEMDDLKTTVMDLRKKDADHQKQLYEKINDTLLPRQLERMSGTLYQRYLKSRTLNPGFEFPLDLEINPSTYQLAKPFFGLENEKLERLRSITLTERDKYIKIRSELKAKAWQKIIDAMPKEMQGHWGAEFGKRFDSEDAFEYGQKSRKKKTRNEVPEKIDK